MNQISEETLTIQSNSESPDALRHNAKAVELEQSNSETDYFENDLSQQEQFVIEDESDDECYEDAIDEIITQNVLEVLNENESAEETDEEGNSSSSESFSDPTESTIVNDILNEREVQIQQVLERQRNELALELRRLQFSNRPQETRNNLENLFNARNTPSNQDNSHISNNNPVNFRSENVLNEISRLNSRQMVSSIQSSFRESIERTLRQRSAQYESRNQNELRAQQQRIPVAPESDPVAPQGRSNFSQRIPVAPQRGTETFGNIIENTRITNENSRQYRNLNSQQNIPRNTTSITPTLPYLLSRSENNPVQDNYREQIIFEIGELVHREVVSNSLQSDFRTRLENTVRNRLARSGNDGDRTRNNIREILANSRVTSNTQRNDFSHLGIQTNQNFNEPADNLDSASSYSGHRHRATVVHHNNAREIRDLKNELHEMKSMLKLSFDMQLDMQRCFKQEISALVAGTFHDITSSRVINSSKPILEGKCIVCTEADCDSVLYQCGHMVSCYSCSVTLKNKGHNCPVCRAPINDVIRAYKCSLN